MSKMKVIAIYGISNTMSVQIHGVNTVDDIVTWSFNTDGVLKESDIEHRHCSDCDCDCDSDCDNQSGFKAGDLFISFNECMRVV